MKRLTPLLFRSLFRGTLGFGITLWIALSSCQSYVQNIDKPINLITDDALNTEASIPILFSALGGYYGYYHRYASIFAATLSDEFVFAEGISYDAVSVNLRDFDKGTPAAWYTDQIWGNLAAMRFQAQNLLERTPLVAFKQDSNRLKCLYMARFYLGLTKHTLAAFFGISPSKGGGTLNGGAFIPSAALHDSALADFGAALGAARTDYERRLAYSFIARIHLLEGRYGDALTAAAKGLREGDSAFSALYPPSAHNTWIDFAGVGRHEIIPDERFRRYVEAEPGEARRVALQRGDHAAPGYSPPYYVQTKYVSDAAPIEIITWQETALTLAECNLRLGNSAAALAAVNAARQAAQLAPRLATNLDSVYVERDKQLFATGLRLLDQRRFNRWHFPPQTAATAWRYLPVSQRERDTNPNLSGFRR